MSAFLRKYNAASHVYVPIIKRGVVDFAVGADWTPATGDVKVSKDGGAAANIGTLPSAVAMGNGAFWDFTLTATELSAARIVVTVADSATKAVEDQAFIVETYGNASAQHAVDLSDSVRAGLTALPNAAAEASGGLYTRGTGAGQIKQTNNGEIDANVTHVNNVAATSVTTVSANLGTTQPVNFTGTGASALAKSDTVDIAGSAVSTSSAQIGVNVVNAAGTAWNSGAIGASTLASDTITAAKIAADAIGASELAADAATEIAAAVASAASATPLAADIKKINGTSVTGNGVSPLWGPA